MAVSISDLQVLIEASVKAALAGQKSTAAGRLDERHFRRLDKLDGKKWKEFSFQFKTAVGSVNTTMRGYLDEIQTGGTPTTTRFSRMTLIRTLSVAHLRLTAFWRQW